MNPLDYSKFLREEESNVPAPHEQPPSTEGVSRAGSDYERATRYVAKVPGSLEGQRNQTLNGLAYCLCERFSDLTEDEHRMLCQRFNAKCIPPLPELEAVNTMKSAWRGCHEKGEVGSKQKPPRSKREGTGTSVGESVPCPKRAELQSTGSHLVECPYEPVDELVMPQDGILPHILQWGVKTGYGHPTVIRNHALVLIGDAAARTHYLQQADGSKLYPTLRILTFGPSGCGKTPACSPLNRIYSTLAREHDSTWCDWDDETPALLSKVFSEFPVADPRNRAVLFLHDEMKRFMSRRNDSGFRERIPFENQLFDEGTARHGTVSRGHHVATEIRVSRHGMSAPNVLERGGDAGIKHDDFTIGWIGRHMIFLVDDIGIRRSPVEDREGEKRIHEFFRDLLDRSGQVEMSITEDARAAIAEYSEPLRQGVRQIEDEDRRERIEPSATKAPYHLLRLAMVFAVSRDRPEVTAKDVEFAVRLFDIGFRQLRWWVTSRLVDDEYQARERELLRKLATAGGRATWADVRKRSRVLKKVGFLKFFLQGLQAAGLIEFEEKAVQSGKSSILITLTELGRETVREQET